MAKNNPTPPKPSPDQAPPEPVYAPPAKGGAYERLPGGGLREMTPPPAAPAEPAIEEK